MNLGARKYVFSGLRTTKMQRQSDRGLCCLSRPFWQATSDQTFTLLLFQTWLKICHTSLQGRQNLVLAIGFVSIFLTLNQ